jgi:hypothetical protein
MNTTNPLIILPALLLLAPLQLFTQAPFTDQVLMEDGTRHDGLIIEQKPGEYIRLWRQANGDTLTLAIEDIDRMLRVTPDTPASVVGINQAAAKGNSPFGTNRYVAMLRISTGGGDYSFHGAGMAVGLRVNNDLQIGIGAQYFGQYSDNTIPQRQLIPLTLDLRYRLNTSPSGRFASLLSLETGLAFSLNKDYFDWGRGQQVSVTNGFYIHPALAFQGFITPNFGLLIDLGYQYNGGHVVAADGGEQLSTKRYSNVILRGSFFF